MKKWLEVLMLPFLLIGGFAATAFGMLVAFAVLSYLSFELFFMTLYNPTIWVLLADGLVAGALAFLVSRKSFRAGVAETWKQIVRNM